MLVSARPHEGDESVEVRAVERLGKHDEVDVLGGPLRRAILRVDEVAGRAAYDHVPPVVVLEPVPEDAQSRYHAHPPNASRRAIRTRSSLRSALGIVTSIVNGSTRFPCAKGVGS